MGSVESSSSRSPIVDNKFEEKLDINGSASSSGGGGGNGNGTIPSSTSTTSSTTVNPRSLPLRSSSTFSLSASQTNFSRMGSLGTLPTNSTSKSTSSMTHPTFHTFDLPQEEIKKPVYNIKKHIQNLDLIRQEFRLLEDTSLPSETSEGDKKHNSIKNRYTNILPCNSTRVILEKIGDKEGTDYINANFIDGVFPKQYICTQGPLQNTISDFWRMMWENSCSIIVMLSREQENCRPKCDRYWPDNETGITPTNHPPLSNNTTQHTFNVKLKDVTRDEKREIIIRKLSLTHMATNSTREITHYQYEGWPDHNAPPSTEPLRHLLNIINDNQNALDVKLQNRPIVVHCSAGVGRTGTFCTVHIMMKRLEEYFVSIDSSSSCSSALSAIDHLEQSKSIDFNLFNIVLQLRAQRPGMVQQMEQYIFCYQTIFDEIQNRLSLKNNL
ncbi:hypothetical protein CYY_009068 [Polysphondylium violaceum]|uniref:Protein tyrosine phosphatase n=1 Tax=Polysphondylium violaceum TaxID=133409 RepID=A0A8J4PKS6_9MYCE|nr:hypothetical protein CYY_009068 [Polysphondylium violaceum]